MNNIWCDFDKKLIEKLLDSKITVAETLITKFNASAKTKRTPGAIWHRARTQHSDKISQGLYESFTAYMQPILKAAHEFKKKEIQKEGGPWVNVEEASKLLFCSQSNIYLLVKQNKIRRSDIGNGTFKYSKPDIIAYRDSRPEYHNIRLKRLWLKKNSQKPENDQQTKLNFDQTTNQEIKAIVPKETISVESIETKTVSITESVETIVDYALEREKGKVLLQALHFGFVNEKQAIEHFEKMFSSIS